MENKSDVKLDETDHTKYITVQITIPQKDGGTLVETYHSKEFVVACRDGDNLRVRNLCTQMFQGNVVRTL